MALLNLIEDKIYYQNIQKNLQKRNLALSMDDDWEVHGPHDFGFQVFVGYAYFKSNGKETRICVAIYPKAVYQINDPTDWARHDSESRIKIGENW